MSGQHKTRSELKKEAIIEGAQRAFQQFGIADTSMDRISEIAKVSKRTIYNHFASKEILVTHIIKEIWGTAVLSFDAPYTSAKDLKAQLVEILINELSVLTKPQIIELSRVVVGHCLFSPNNFKKEIAEFFGQETALLKWIKAAMKDGKLKDGDPVIAREQIMSLLKGQGLWPQILHAEAPLDTDAQVALADQTADFFLGYYQTR